MTFLVKVGKGKIYTKIGSGVKFFNLAPIALNKNHFAPVFPKYFFPTCCVCCGKLKPTVCPV